MDKPLFEEGTRVVYPGASGSGGVVTKVIATYQYEVEWDDRDPEWDIYKQSELNLEATDK